MMTAAHALRKLNSRRVLAVAPLPVRAHPCRFGAGGEPVSARHNFFSWPSHHAPTQAVFRDQYLEAGRVGQHGS